VRRETQARAHRTRAQYLRRIARGADRHDPGVPASVDEDQSDAGRLQGLELAQGGGSAELCVGQQLQHTDHEAVRRQMFRYVH